MEHEFMSQLTSAAIVVYLLQWAKSCPIIPWITEHSKGISRLTSAGLAAVSAIGVHYSFDAEAGRLVVEGLTVSGLLHGLWLFGNQFALQQLAYDAVLNKSPNGV